MLKCCKSKKFKKLTKSTWFILVSLCTTIPLEELEKLLPEFTVKENNSRDIGVLNINETKIEISSLKGNSIEEYLSKRGITINAMACNKEGKIIDPFGGINDIRNNNIKLVQKDGHGIEEDPIIILQILSYQSSLNYSLSENTKKVITEKCNLLTEVREEEIINELKIIIQTENPANIIKDNKEIFYQIIEELKETDGFKQNNPYHIYDVFEHTMKVL